jgi:hypothetical protein
MSLILVLLACHRAPPPANPEFTDAVKQTFVAFDAPNVEIAFAVRALETAITTSLDVASDNSLDRSFAPEDLTEADVAGLTRPDVPPEDALPVAVATLSPFPIADQQHVQLLADQTPVEPYSPNVYDRTFLEGEDCWLDHGCERLETFNVLVKENALMTIPYEFKKSFRWLDLNLPDPIAVPEDEEPPVVTSNPRWGYIGRSWQEESFSGEDGDTTLVQSYTIEVWLPFDEATTLRMLAVWSQTELGINMSDDMVAGTIRVGIDDNFEAGDDWLEENAGAEP